MTNAAPTSPNAPASSGLVEVLDAKFADRPTWDQVEKLIADRLRERDAEAARQVRGALR